MGLQEGPSPRPVSLHLNGYRRFDSRKTLDIRIFPGASWTELNPVYTVEWGVTHENGNHKLGKVIDKVYYDNQTNILGLLAVALDAIREESTTHLDHDRWSYGKEIENGQ